jgi:hypothetical protein
MTPIFDSLNSKFLDVQQSAETRGYVRGIRQAVSELRAIPKPTKQVIDLLERLEAVLALAHKPAKRGRR